MPTALIDIEAYLKVMLKRKSFIITAIGLISLSAMGLVAILAKDSAAAGPWCHTFNTNLRVGDRTCAGDSDIEAASLEVALVKEGLMDAHNGDCVEFDEQMASTVVEFQEKYASEILKPSGLKRGTGYVGPSTRAKLNKLYGCGKTPPACVKEGVTGGLEVVNNEAYTKPCCNGLTSLSTNFDNNCNRTQVKEGSSYICTACGNGICGKGENTCNCPTDCKSGTVDMATQLVDNYLRSYLSSSKSNWERLLDYKINKIEVIKDEGTCFRFSANFSVKPVSGTGLWSPHGNMSSRDWIENASLGFDATKQANGSYVLGQGYTGAGSASCKIEKTVKVITPNGGETLISGNSGNVTIKWQSTGIDKVDIRLIDYDYVTSTSKPIAENITASNGIYYWSSSSVADILDNNFKAGDKFRIVIAEKKTDGTFGVQDQSDGFVYIDTKVKKSITVSTPAANQVITSPVLISGKAVAFEGQFNIRIKDGNGVILYNANTMGASSYGDPQPFSAKIVYNTPTAKNGTIEVFEFSAKDGSEINKVTVPVSFGDYQPIACFGEGEGVLMWSGSDIKCCSGLTKIGHPNGYSESGSGCAMLLKNGNICTYCGNGVCGKGENTCNCPSDCKTTTKSITVLSPNGKEKLTVGQTYNITWSSSGLNGKYINIRLNLDNPKFAAGLDIKQKVLIDLGKYSWTVPATLEGFNLSEVANKYIIEISTLKDAGYYNDFSDDNFSISTAPSVAKVIDLYPGKLTTEPTSFRVQVCNRGQERPATVSMRITANGITLPTTGIGYMSGDQVPWPGYCGIARSEYSWFKMTAGNKYHIKVEVDPSAEVSETNETNNEKEYDLTVPGAKISLITPNGGEQIAKGSTYNITWQGVGVGEKVVIMVYKKGDFVNYATTPALAVPNTGQYLWTVTDDYPAGGGYMIMIYDQADPTLADSSDRSFNIWTD